MAEAKPSRNKDGSKIGSQEYVTLALCIIVPIVGLLFAAFYQQQGERWAPRALIVGVVALLAWIALVLLI